MQVIDINRDEFEITKLKIIAKKKRSLESINTEILKERYGLTADGIVKRVLEKFPFAFFQ